MRPRHGAYNMRPVHEVKQLASSGRAGPAQRVFGSPGLAEAPRRPRREAPETTEARRAKPVINCRGAEIRNNVVQCTVRGLLRT